jgi:hypothetical protein
VFSLTLCHGITIISCCLCSPLCHCSSLCSQAPLQPHWPNRMPCSEPQTYDFILHHQCLLTIECRAGQPRAHGNNSQILAHLHSHHSSSLTTTIPHTQHQITHFSNSPCRFATSRHSCTLQNLGIPKSHLTSHPIGLLIVFSYHMSYCRG